MNIDSFLNSDSAGDSKGLDSVSTSSKSPVDATNDKSESETTTPYVTNSPDISVSQTYNLVTDLEPYHTTYGIYHDYNRTDVYNNEYEYALVGFVNMSSGKQYYSYSLGQKYDSLTFTAFADCQHDAKEEYNAFIYIYGDDNCIYKNESINCVYRPENVILDVHEYNDLRIELYGQGFEYNGSYGVAAGMGNISLTGIN